MHGDLGVLDSWRVSGALFLHLQYEICHIESGAYVLWSGFHLWSSLLSQVTRSVSDSPVKPRWSLKMNEDPVLSLHLVFQGHVATSNAATLTLLTRLKNTTQTVQIWLYFFLSFHQYLLHICFLFMELYTLPFFYEIAKICRFKALEISNRAEDVVMSQYGQMCWSRKLFWMLKPSNEVR